MISTEFANGECRVPDPPSVRGQLDGSHPNSGCGPSFPEARYDRTGRLTRNRRLSGIVNCLRQAAGGIVSRAEIIEWLYGDSPEGGPLNANLLIDLAVLHLRRCGFPIVTHYGRGFRYAWKFHEIEGSEA